MTRVARRSNPHSAAGLKQSVLTIRRRRQISIRNNEKCGDRMSCKSKLPVACLHQAYCVSTKHVDTPVVCLLNSGKILNFMLKNYIQKKNKKTTNPFNYKSQRGTDLQIWGLRAKAFLGAPLLQIKGCAWLIYRNIVVSWLVEHCLMPSC